MAIEVRKVILEGVSDASGLATLIDDGVFAADEIIGVIGKTEGNGGVNDFTRILADQAFRKVLMDKGTRPADEVKQIPMVWSGGVDGVLCPHATVFAEVEAEPSDELRLTVGIAMSDPILPEEIGRVAMVEKVAEGVRRAMAEAGIEDPADVHYVQTKTPLLTMETIVQAKARGNDVVTEETLRSMDISNGRSDLPRPQPFLCGRLLFVWCRTRSSTNRRHRQCPRGRRQLPDRPQRDGRCARHRFGIRGDS